MEDMKQAVINAMEKIIESGSIEKKIEETIQKTIETVIQDTFRDWSDFGEDLKNQLTEKLKIDFDKMDIPAYNVMIENSIKSRLTDILAEQHHALINENLKSILSVEEEDWTLSEFIEEFKSGLQKYDGEKAGEQITCIIESGNVSSIDMWHIYIDENKDTEKYRCDIKIFVSDNKIKSVDWHGKNWNKDKFLGWKHNIEATLFRIYSQGKQFIVDEDDVDTYFSDYD